MSESKSRDLKEELYPPIQSIITFKVREIEIHNDFPKQMRTNKRKIKSKILKSSSCVYNLKKPIHRLSRNNSFYAKYRQHVVKDRKEIKLWNDLRNELVPRQKTLWDDLKEELGVSSEDTRSTFRYR
mmetsp:Transcript_41046/g.46634  ORF Transcript_41046/g.46634 Transcript_41046/m.46634 type:complete len:127 (+) Transcript_41046:63-443(+)